MRTGRYWVGLWLTFVLATLLWVVGRYTSAVGLADRNSELRGQRSTLEALKAEQLRRIREAGSRSALGPRAAEIGLRFPADSEIVILELPSGPR